MKTTLLIVMLTSFVAAADRMSPMVGPIEPEAIIPALEAPADFRAFAPIIRRGLVGTQMTYRARSAQ